VVTIDNNLNKQAMITNKTVNMYIKNIKTIPNNNNRNKIK